MDMNPDECLLAHVSELIGDIEDAAVDRAGYVCLVSDRCRQAMRVARECLLLARSLLPVTLGAWYDEIALVVKETAKDDLHPSRPIPENEMNPIQPGKTGRYVEEGEIPF